MINKNFIHELFNTSIYFGQKINKYNTNTLSYLYLKKKNVYYFNLLLIYKLLKLLSKIIYKINFYNGKFLIVDDKKNNISLFNNLHNCYYLTSKWEGGLLTNWINFKIKLKKILLLENSIFKFSKQINNKLNKKINLFNKLFYGLKKMEKLPDFVIFTNYKKNYLGINECIKLGIPFISFFDINCNSNKINYPLPCNSQSIIANNYLINFLINQIKKK